MTRPLLSFIRNWLWEPVITDNDETRLPPVAPAWEEFMPDGQRRSGRRFNADEALIETSKRHAAESGPSGPC